MKSNKFINRPCITKLDKEINDTIKAINELEALEVNIDKLRDLCLSLFIKTDMLLIKYLKDK